MKHLRFVASTRCIPSTRRKFMAGIQWRIGAEPGSKLLRRRRAPVSEPEQVEDTGVIDVRHKNLSEASPAEKLLESFDPTEEKAAEMELLTGPLPGRFRSFSFANSVDVLVAEDEEMKLNLARSYLYDVESKIYAKPFCSKDVPDEYLGYLIMEWDTWISGDVVYDEEEQIELEKVYFVKQLPLKGNQMYPHVELTELYCIDSETRRIEKIEVLDLRDGHTIDPILRIKEDGIVIMDSRDCPTIEDIALSEEIKDHLEERKRMKEDMMQFDQSLLEETYEPEDSIDEEPDLPEADL